jgi:hypothetical protein
MVVQGSKGVVKGTGVNGECSWAWMALLMMWQGYETWGVVKQQVSRAPGASWVVGFGFGGVLLVQVVCPIVPELHRMVQSGAEQRIWPLLTDMSMMMWQPCGVEHGTWG